MDLTAAVDVYALGAVLMFAMTGRYPYERPTVPALLLAVTDPATDPDLSGLPEEIRQLITGMLAHHPASRRTLADVVNRAEGDTERRGSLPRRKPSLSSRS